MKKRTEKTVAISPVSVIRQRVDNGLRKAANWLNGKVAGWKPCWLKTTVVVFLLSGTWFSAWFCIAAVSPSNHQPLVSTIRRPASLYVFKHAQLFEAHPVTNRDLMRIDSFARYMATLDTTEVGRRIKDSLLLDRPGLKDSLQHVIELYHQK